MSRWVAGSINPSAPELVAAFGSGVHVTAYGAKGDGTTDDTAAIQATINAVAAKANGGVVHFPAATYLSGTVTLKQGVSIVAERGAVIKLKANAGTFLISDQFATYAGAGNAWNGLNGFVIDGLRIEGNSANQTDSAAADYRGRNAIIKLCGYNFTLRNLRINDAKEIALYTEHDYSWDNDTNTNGQGFNQFAFGESTFENVYAKNYGVAGWINRGPHDSHAKSVYLSSYNVSGLHAVNGYVGQLNTSAGQAYGGQGLVADNLHVWGEHSDSSVLLDGANITQGKLYAEGATVAAIRIKSGGSNSFDAVIDWAPVGVQIESGNDNELTLFVGGNLTASAVKIIGGASGNRLDVKHGGVYGAGAAMFDLSAGYTGGNNTFITGHPYGVVLFNGTPGVNDRIDAVSDNYPDWNRISRWELPMGDTKIKAVYGTGFDIGTMALIMGGRTVNWAAAIPTTGTYARGSILFNSAPAASGTMGWMCVTAGTPGTWKAMPNLAA